ncbi:hypothetical protein BIW11_04557 [Tropilaelaps mercedesae]|uniref:Ig-like domain-containing protein n=1 Tax=Tropilaelaps mercedesae TaxID=418985 RepID=A0A1V9X4E1_9ACAR|nr:hypothetical protein BIW11_04557 [Tropilaelaps mercedesae]
MNAATDSVSDDSGFYTCIAWDDSGESRRSAFLKVLAVFPTTSSDYAVRSTRERGKGGSGVVLGKRLTTRLEYEDEIGRGKHLRVVIAARLDAPTRANSGASAERRCLPLRGADQRRVSRLMMSESSQRIIDAHGLAVGAAHHVGCFGWLHDGSGRRQKRPQRCERKRIADIDDATLGDVKREPAEGLRGNCLELSRIAAVSTGGTRRPKTPSSESANTRNDMGEVRPASTAGSRLAIRQSLKTSLSRRRCRQGLAQPRRREPVAVTNRGRLPLAATVDKDGAVTATLIDYVDGVAAEMHDWVAYD